MEITLLLIRLFLFGIFIVAGIGKLLDLEGSEKAVKDFGVPKDLANPLSLALPVAEIVIAFLLLATSTARLGAFGAVLLLSIFIGGMIRQMQLGNAPECHCFGQIHSEPVGAKSLIRNIVFAVLALIVLIFGGGIGVSDLANETALQLFLGLGIVGLLFIAVNYLKKISEQQTLIIRRIELLEMIGGEGVEAKREDVHTPHDGLPIGAPAPDFELPDLNGKIVSFEHLLMTGKPSLLLFVSPSCNPCQALLPEIETWQNEFGERMNFVFISSGTSEENIEKFGGATEKIILLQKKKEIGELFAAPWTPTAIYINDDGIIGSRPAAGDTAICELVEMIKAAGEDEKFFYVHNADSFGKPPKIGERIPEFSIKDLQGSEITDKDFLGKQTLVTFFGTTCPHCIAMHDDLRGWEENKSADEPNLVIFSEGDVEEHKEYDLSSPILLEKNYKTAIKFGMHGTPSAVLIDENGVIISETAIGAPQIWALVGKRRGEGR